MATLVDGGVEQLLRCRITHPHHALTRPHCGSPPMRRPPSRQSTAHGPVIEVRLVWSPTEPMDAHGMGCTCTFASTPMSSAKYSHHCWTLTAVSPAKFTIVAGTLA